MGITWAWSAKGSFIQDDKGVLHERTPDNIALCDLAGIQKPAYRKFITNGEHKLCPECTYCLIAVRQSKLVKVRVEQVWEWVK